MILRAEEIFKDYSQGDEDLRVLKGVSLSLDRAETVAIMGRSGCGKSTLITLLAGLDSPTRGRIEIMGQDLARLPGHRLNRFRAETIGIIFQQFHLLDHLTAFENVRLPMDLNGVEDADDKARAILERVGLGHRLHHFPQQMSRGECQRVAIARVLVMKPAVLLADEPTGSLDVKTGREVMEMLFQLVESERLALLMVTHDPQIAEKCRRRLYMDEGVLYAERPASLM